jgi:hypothetical protein
MALRRHYCQENVVGRLFRDHSNSRWCGLFQLLKWQQLHFWTKIIPTLFACFDFYVKTFTCLSRQNWNRILHYTKLSREFISFISGLTSCVGRPRWKKIRLRKRSDCKNGCLERRLNQSHILSRTVWILLIRNQYRIIFRSISGSTKCSIFKWVQHKPLHLFRGFSLCVSTIKFFLVYKIIRPPGPWRLPVERHHSVSSTREFETELQHTTCERQSGQWYVFEPSELTSSLCFAHTMNICFPYDSYTKHRLFSYTALCDCWDF